MVVPDYLAKVGRLVATEGLCNKDVAARLGVTPATAKEYMLRLTRALRDAGHDVHTRTELVVLVARHPEVLA